MTGIRIGWNVSRVAVCQFHLKVSAVINPGRENMIGEFRRDFTGPAALVSVNSFD